MSTLMSTDMNLKRPSTRVSVPPGGASTIDLGGSGYNKPPAKVVEAVAPPVIPTAEPEIVAPQGYIQNYFYTIF